MTRSGTNDHATVASQSSRPPVRARAPGGCGATEPSPRQGAPPARAYRFPDGHRSRASAQQDECRHAPAVSSGSYRQRANSARLPGSRDRPGATRSPEERRAWMRPQARERNRRRHLLHRAVRPRSGRPPGRRRRPAPGSSPGPRPRRRRSRPRPGPGAPAPGSPGASARTSGMCTVPMRPSPPAPAPRRVTPRAGAPRATSSRPARHTAERSRAPSPRRWRRRSAPWRWARASA